MSVKKGLLWSLAVAVLPLLMVACGGAEATPTPGPGEPTPTLDFQATIAAQARAADIGTPTPTPVPPEDRAVVLDFAKRHDGIDRDWERLHTDFDKWREGLIACDANTLQATLREFAARFSAVAEEARRLPRSRPVRELADKLIGAIEGEAAALRLLRDNWRPGDPAVFAAMDLERSAASALQKEVQDELTDLQKRTSIASREIVATYSLAFRGLNTEWDKFHGKYDDFRAAEADLTSADTVLRLSELIDDVSDIVAEVRNLSTSEVTSGVTQILAKAAEDEDLALRKLRGTFQKSEGAPAGEPSPLRQSPKGTPPPSTSEDSEVIFEPLDPFLFDVFNDQLVESNALRREARQRLARIQEATSEESQVAVDEFTSQYNLVLRARSEFHKSYDDWRRTEGGCDRSQAIAALGGFSLRFSELASTVRELPRATFLRPVGELLVEAAEREERSMRILRQAWRPFDALVYEGQDQERNTAGKLRRQAASGIQVLLVRYDISLQDFAR